jgi:hypothetical protein
MLLEYEFKFVFDDYVKLFLRTRNDPAKRDFDFYR